MRDPKRIHEVVKVLAALWYQNPDLRLGQLIFYAGSDLTDAVAKDPFYIEDDVMLERMQAKLKFG